MNRLKVLRERMGISQKELSDIWNTSQSSISQWESGAVEMDYKTLIKASHFYNTSIDFILCNDESPNPDTDEGLLFDIFKETSKAGRTIILEVARVVADNT